jgi:hypothetical protein
MLTLLAAACSSGPVQQAPQQAPQPAAQPAARPEPTPAAETTGEPEKAPEKKPPEPPTPEELVAKLLDEKSTLEARLALVNELANRRDDRKKVMDVFIDALATENGEVREALGAALLKMGSEAHQRLVWKAEEKGTRQGQVAAKLLERVVAEYIAQLDSQDDEERKQAVEAVGELGHVAHAAIPKLKRMIAKDEMLEAIEALGAVTRPQDVKKVLPLLLRELRKKNNPWASKGIAAIGPPAAKAVPVLTKKLRGAYQAADDLMIVFTLHALGSIGPKAARAIPAITPILEESTWSHEAAQALGGIGKKGIPVLIRHLNSDEEHQRHAAREGLTFVPESALPELEKLRTHKDPKVREAVEAAIEEIKR